MHLRASTPSDRGQASVELAGLLCLVALVFAAALAVGRAPAGELPGLVDRYASGELDDFLAYRDSALRDPRLDFSTDGCSAPIVGSRGDSFDFTEPCLRHDFGYRNYGRLGLFDDRRRFVDARFLADMRDSCEANRTGWALSRCLGWARTFYLGVRLFGWTARP